MAQKRMKGQVWSLDFSVSVVIFFTVLVMVLFAWSYASARDTERLLFNEMESKSISLSDSLIRTQGYPQDWNQTNVEIMGLADDENVLNETKILQFMNMSYDSTRATMNIMNYRYHFRLEYLNGTTIQLNGISLVKGEDPTLFSNSTLVVPMERYVLFDHKVARLKFILWV